MTADAGRRVPLLPADTRLVHLASCGSTNAEAMRLAAAGDDLPLWVLADRQMAGRGRSGRGWVSEPGNLLASLVVPLSAPPSAIPQLSLLAGVAAVDAIRAACGDVPGLRLKWPNDVLAGGGKLGGILVEASEIRSGRVAVIGIGINVATAPVGLERGAASLADLGFSVNTLEMLAFLAEAMHEWLANWQAGAGFGDVRGAWLGRTGPSGEPISVNGSAGPLSGSFAGLDPDGALLMRETGSGAMRRITFGDVTIGN